MAFIEPFLPVQLSETHLGTGLAAGWHNRREAASLGKVSLNSHVFVFRLQWLSDYVHRDRGGWADFNMQDEVKDWDANKLKWASFDHQSKSWILIPLLVLLSFPFFFSFPAPTINPTSSRRMWPELIAHSSEVRTTESGYTDSAFMWCGVRGLLAGTSVGTTLLEMNIHSVWFEAARLIISVDSGCSLQLLSDCLISGDGLNFPCAGGMWNMTEWEHLG